MDVMLKITYNYCDMIIFVTMYVTCMLELLFAIRGKFKYTSLVLFAMYFAEF